MKPICFSTVKFGSTDGYMPNEAALLLKETAC